MTDGLILIRARLKLVEKPKLERCHFGAKIRIIGALTRSYLCRYVFPLQRAMALSSGGCSS